MNNTNNILVDVKNLRKTFAGKAKSLTVFGQLSFSVKEGETICFLGPSGCGKSTLLRCLAGLTDHEGSVLIGGEPPAVLSKSKKLGFAFQDAALIDWLTVYDNVMMSSNIGESKMSHAEAKARVEELLMIVGLTDYKKFLPHQLSGGMKQRVSLARALFQQPQLLLLDEPFSALDSLTSIKLSILFNRILKTQRTTTVLISHNIQEAVFLADRIFILSPLPATIIKEVPVNLCKERDIKFFDDTDFSHIVAECRNELFKNEIEN